MDTGTALDVIAALCMGGAVLLLVLLSVVDLRVRLLPNEMVLGFATLGLVFHLTTMAAYIPIVEIAAGGLAGFGAMYLIRAVANKLYDTDALGMGDVKLLGAAGLWLGPDGVMLAMSAGAFAALLHGVFYALRESSRTKTPPQFARLQIPAGPGFAVGIVLAGIVQFRDFTLF